MDISWINSAWSTLHRDGATKTETTTSSNTKERGHFLCKKDYEHEEEKCTLYRV